MGALIAAPAPAPRRTLPALNPTAPDPAPHPREVAAGTAMTVHLARRCECGAGVSIKGAAYAVQAAPRVVGRIPAPVELQVHCGACGSLALYTHVAVKVGGAFSKALKAGRTT